jgi:hypothetical protein
MMTTRSIALSSTVVARDEDRLGTRVRDAREDEDLGSS